MKLFIIGISGLLGINFALQTRSNFEVSGSYRRFEVKGVGIKSYDVDVTSKGQLESILTESLPDIIVNTVALTDVDACESNHDLAYALNTQSARDAAEISRQLGAKLIHISTDQLFDGSAQWVPEADPPCALNEYGRTKGLGEEAVLAVAPNALILRTNFFGWGTASRTSFSDWVLTGLKAEKELTMFTDVFFNPISINHLVDTALDLAEIGASGIFNAVGSERLSKFEFGRKVAQVFGYSDSKIRPISVNDLNLKANRPKEMTLDCSKVENQLGRKMPTVIEGLEHLYELNNSGWQEKLNNMIQHSPIQRPA